MEIKRQKGTIISSENIETDLMRVFCIRKILQFDDDIDYKKFDFLFGNKKNRPKRLIKLLVTLDCFPYLEKIHEIIFNEEEI